MPATTSLPLPTLSAEVLAFAAAHGVARSLPLLAAGARRIFPDARIEIHLEADPEIDGNRQIVFDVDENEREADEQVAAHREWMEELLRACPATHTHLFCLIKGSLT